ncbi:RDD family protein [Desulfomonile tiedjei]|uniref:Putative membrane protein/domain protein n=1 Tax=Desulfomonile tiedjei (strain ATCC 49306 / DSM 6799 / DCB-1) TaxID=706587 RepID=I4CDI2_DESTA|nr:RDD family protein [Desulfomonile tiedjei]AFM27623.1 putative membrane protein/domain protein [Desulfomonile tiedjei DSM 6799]
MKEKVKTVVIDTPDRGELRFQLAGIGTRMIAYLVDKFIQIGALLGIVLILAIVLFLVGQMDRFVELLSEAGQSLGLWSIAIAILFYEMVTIGYFLFFEYFWNGATPGKKFQKTRVIRKDGRPMSFGDSVVRNALRIVDIIGELYPVGLIVMFCDFRNRRLGDLAAGTLVIDDDGTSALPVSKIPAETLEIFEVNSLVARMNAEDYVLVARFLSRRDELDVRHRTQLAMNISRRILKRTMAFGEDFDHEAFLEKIEVMYRERTREL